MYDRSLLSHEKRCNAMITIPSPDNHKRRVYTKPKIKKVLDIQRDSYDDRITRKVERKDRVGKFVNIIQIYIDNELYTMKEFSDRFGLKFGYAKYISSMNDSCYIDDILCEFKRIKKPISVYNITCKDGSILEKKTARQVSEIIDVSTSAIYSVNKVKGKFIKGFYLEKVKE